PEPCVRMGEWRGKKALIEHQTQRSQHCQCCEDNDAIAKGWEGDGRSNAHSRDVEQVPIPGNGCSNPPTRPLDDAAIREWYRHANAATHPVAGVVINGNARSSARTHPVVDGATNEGNRCASAATRSIEPAAIGRNARSNAPTDPVAGVGISERCYADGAPHPVAGVTRRGNGRSNASLHPVAEAAGAKERCVNGPTHPVDGMAICG